VPILTSVNNAVLLELGGGNSSARLRVKMQMLRSNLLHCFSTRLRRTVRANAASLGCGSASSWVSVDFIVSTRLISN